MSVGTIAKVDRYRQMILTAAHKSGQPQHLASCMSIIHILHVLYDHVMDHKNDLFVLSKGHAALALYAVLAARGEIKPEDLGTIGHAGSILGGHPDRMKVPGVTASTGSLGTGIGMAVGMAMAKKMKGEPGIVYCLIGDGEMQEGSVAEAMMGALDLGVDNVCILMDDNATHGERSGRVGCKLGDLQMVLEKTKKMPPFLLSVHTIKGHGVRAMEMAPNEWHRRALTDHEYNSFMLEVSDVSYVSATRH